MQLIFLLSKTVGSVVWAVLHMNRRYRVSYLPVHRLQVEIFGTVTVLATQGDSHKSLCVSTDGNWRWAQVEEGGG